MQDVGAGGAAQGSAGTGGLQQAFTRGVLRLGGLLVFPPSHAERVRHPVLPLVPVWCGTKYSAPCPADNALSGGLKYQQPQRGAAFLACSNT